MALAGLSWRTTLFTRADSNSDTWTASAGHIIRMARSLRAYLPKGADKGKARSRCGFPRARTSSSSGVAKPKKSRKSACSTRNGQPWTGSRSMRTTTTPPGSPRTTRTCRSHRHTCHTTTIVGIIIIFRL